MSGVLGPLLVAALTGVMLVELLRRLPLFQTIADLAANVRRGSQVMAHRTASDHWKQKILIGRSLLAMAATLRLCAFLAVMAAAALGLVFLSDIPFPGMSEFLLSFAGIAAMTAVGCVYFWLVNALRQQ